MLKLTRDLIQTAIDLDKSGVDVINWASPVPVFGNLIKARIGTLGINPSNLEFVDSFGEELDGVQRRFQTLRSLQLSNWDDATDENLETMWDSCEQYFFRNPYDRWFKKLDYVIAGTSLSYYFPSSDACHLDLVPFATSQKWTELSSAQKERLLESGRGFLVNSLEASGIKVLLLNGQSVVREFERISNETLTKSEMPGWTLRRAESDGVVGYSYEGRIDQVGGLQLNRTVLVLGYNHNIQSSYGVSRLVLDKIRNWITEKTKGEL